MKRAHPQDATEIQKFEVLYQDLLADSDCLGDTESDEESDEKYIQAGDEDTEGDNSDS